MNYCEQTLLRRAADGPECAMIWYPYAGDGLTHALGAARADALSNSDSTPSGKKDKGMYAPKPAGTSWDAVPAFQKENDAYC
jgi:hypothetical protein